MRTLFRYLLFYFALVYLSACNTTPPPIPQEVPFAAQCGAAATAIDKVSSTLADRFIIEGVVTASFQAEHQLHGFFLQAKASTPTSLNTPPAALFIHDQGLGIPVQQGDYVRVQGEKSQYAGALALNNITAVTHCGKNQTIATQELLLPIEYVAQLDRLLHQPIHLSQPMYVTGHYQLARYGTLDIASERLWVPTQITMPGPSARDHASYNFLRSLVLDDGSTLENPDPVPYPPPGLSIHHTVRSGDTVHHITGILVKMGDAYHIHPIQTPRFVASNPRPETVQLPAQGDLTLAAFNVLNYFNGDAASGGFPTARGAKTAAEFERQRTRIIQAMLAINADVFALMEMANNGFSEHSALADLTRGLQAAAPAGARYHYVQVPQGKIGNDVITQAIIYRADKVATVGQAAFTETAPFESASRPPLAQSFRSLATGAEFTLVANHFKSKGSCPRDASNPNRDRHDGQGCWNPTRVESAKVLAHWLRSYPTGQEHNNYIVLGDFNAYAMEDPLQELRRQGYINVANRLAPDSYSYVYRGEMGSLDHILVHHEMIAAVTGIDFWHINADEPRALEYGLSYKSSQQQQDWYAPTPYRSSDHDPVIIKINSLQLLDSNDKTDYLN